MKAKGLQIGVTLKITLYLSLGILLISGVIWLVAHYLLFQESDFELVRSPLEPISMKIHGAIVPIFMLGLGALFPIHISRAYKAGINLTTGISTLLLLGCLIITGYLLYYSGDENFRQWSSVAHSVLGLMLAPFLIVHIVRGRVLMGSQRG